jgi:hypothetical protein
MVVPLFNAQDDEWVTLVGRYILNMGAVELATRLIIARIDGPDQVPIFSDDLAARLGYIRKRFPRSETARHGQAMNTLNVALRHSGFRNVVAHSPIAISGHADGTFKIQGIMNVTPKSSTTLVELVSLEELKGRVNESAAIAREMLDVQSAFPVLTGG